MSKLEDIIAHATPTDKEMTVAAKDGKVALARAVRTMNGINLAAAAPVDPEVCICRV